MTHWGKDWLKQRIKGAIERLSGIPSRVASADARSAAHWMNENRIQLLKGTAALVLIAAVSISGNLYVKAHTKEVYHVYVNGQAAGTVSDPEIVRHALADQKQKLKQEYPNLHMVLDTGEISFAAERAFQAESHDARALLQLNRLVSSYAEGTKLYINGHLAGIVKDEATAESILNQYKEEYSKPGTTSGQVKIMSAASAVNRLGDASKGKVDSVSFVQDVTMEDAAANPDNIMEPQTMLRRLRTGGVKQKTYTVQKGDCISCIAHKLGISTQTIKANNSWIADDIIHPGDVLDVTVLKPELSVKTVETVVEDEIIHYGIHYQKDPDLRAGKIVVVRPGKEGLRQVAYRLTKINGQLQKAERIAPQTVREPVAELAKKGTRTVHGQEVGQLGWSDRRAHMAGSFGMRGEELYKAADLVSSENGA